MERLAVKNLSKAVLELKFMKRTKEKARILREEEEREELYQEQLASLNSGADKVVMLTSYYDVTSYLPCRLSFGGIEPETEKLNEDRLIGLYKVERTKTEEVGHMETDVPAEEAVDYMPFNRSLWKDKKNKDGRKNPKGWKQKGRNQKHMEENNSYMEPDSFSASCSYNEDDGETDNKNRAKRELSRQKRKYDAFDSSVYPRKTKKEKFIKSENND